MKKNWYVLGLSSMVAISLLVQLGMAQTSQRPVPGQFAHGYTITPRKQLVDNEFKKKFIDSIKTTSLKNGIPFYHKTTNSDISYLILSIKWNSNELKKEDRVLKAFIEQLLTKGSVKYPSNVIGAHLEKNAMSFSCGYSGGDPYPCGTSFEKMQCTLEVDNMYLDDGLDVFASSILTPEFNDVDYEAVLKNSRSGFQSSCRDSDHTITNLLINKVFYNHDHPWFTTEQHLVQSVAKVTKQKIKEVYAGLLNAYRMNIFAATSLSAKQFKQKLNQHFGGIPDWFVDLQPSPPPTRSARKVAVKYALNEEVGSSKQNVFILMKTMIKQSGHHKDAVAIKVLHKLLEAQLYKNIRTKHGLSYLVGAYDHHGQTFGLSAIYASTSQPTEVIKQINKTVAAMKAELIDEQLLYEAKLKFLPHYYREISNPTSLLQLLSGHVAMFSTINQLYVFDDQVDAVTPELIQQLARRHLNDYQIAFYGDKKLLAQIKLKFTVTH